MPKVTIQERKPEQTVVEIEQTHAAKKDRKPSGDDAWIIEEAKRIVVKG